MSVENIRTIQDIYQAFAAQDVQAITEKCSPTTRWAFNGAIDAVPWHVPVSNRDELPKFFTSLAGAVDFEAFTPGEFMHCGPHVVVDVHLEYRVKATGRRVVQDQLQWWTLDPQHRVERLVHFEDTAQVRDAVLG